jgi:hypothetical protein
MIIADINNPRHADMWVLGIFVLLAFPESTARREWAAFPAVE